MALLLPQSVGDRHDPLGESVAALALRAEAALAPEDEGPELALAVVVRGFDAGHVDESPEGLPVLKDVGARAADAAHTEARATVEVTFDDWTQLGHELAELASRHGAVADAVPAVDHRPRQHKQIRAELARGAGALRKTHELANQVSPANLAALHRPKAELRAAIGDEDPLDHGEEATKAGFGGIWGDAEKGLFVGRRGRVIGGPA